MMMASGTASTIALSSPRCSRSARRSDCRDSSLLSHRARNWTNWICALLNGAGRGAVLEKFNVPNSVSPVFSGAPI